MVEQVTSLESSRITTWVEIQPSQPRTRRSMPCDGHIGSWWKKAILIRAGVTWPADLMIPLCFFESFFAPTFSWSFPKQKNVENVAGFVCLLVCLFVFFFANCQLSGFWTGCLVWVDGLFFFVIRILTPDVIVNETLAPCYFELGNI